jgi:hypothetical protein
LIFPAEAIRNLSKILANAEFQNPNQPANLSNNLGPAPGYSGMKSAYLSRGRSGHLTKGEMS